MKKIVFLAVMIMTAIGLKAQDCEALVLPYFEGNTESLEYYKSVAPEKYNFRCAFAQSAFYESDTVPAGIQIHSISEVVEKASGNHLPNDIVIDLNTFSYYAYNFNQFNMGDNVTLRVYFSTPNSQHPYLVLRTYGEMMAIAENVFKEPQTR